MDNKRSVFVIMPFSATETCTESEWTDIYENVFRPAIEDCGYSCEKAQPETGSLIKTILEKLKSSTIVLADITDKNPNVLYELGVRHCLSKRTIIVAQSADHIPSDLRGYWSIIYGTRPGEVKKFRTDIKKLIAKIENEPDKSDSPVSDYLVQEDRQVEEIKNEIHAKIDKALQEISIKSDFEELVGILETAIDRSSRIRSVAVARTAIISVMKLLNEKRLTYDDGVTLPPSRAKVANMAAAMAPTVPPNLIEGEINVMIDGGFIEATYLQGPAGNPPGCYLKLTERAYRDAS